MRYNPCGRIVEMMRRPYSIPCRFLRDSDLVGTVKWAEARPDALTLGKTCIISSQDWELDRGLFPVEVGEQEGRRKFAAATAPVGSGRGHVCGTDEDFDQGGIYDDVLPPVLYDALGYPRCCSGARNTRGGGGGGGRSRPVIVRNRSYGGAGASGRSIVTPPHAIHQYGGAGASGRSIVTPPHEVNLYGGAGASGRSIVTPPHAIHQYGGAGASARSMVAIAPVCDTFGPICTLAALDELHHWCQFETTTKTDRWRAWTVEPGETYRFELFRFLDGGHHWSLYTGFACESKTTVADGDFHIAYQVYEFVAGGRYVWWRLGGQIAPGFSAGVTRLTLLP